MKHTRSEYRRVALITRRIEKFIDDHTDKEQEAEKVTGAILDEYCRCVEKYGLDVSREISIDSRGIWRCDDCDGIIEGNKVW